MVNTAAWPSSHVAIAAALGILVGYVAVRVVRPG
jgi:hypothetical protein